MTESVHKTSFIKSNKCAIIICSVLCLVIISIILMRRNVVNVREPLINEDVKIDTDTDQIIKYPLHWLNPPNIQTEDYVELPLHYGHGSSTIKIWIENCILMDTEMESIKNLYNIKNDHQILEWKNTHGLSIDTVYSMFEYYYVPDIIKNVYKIPKNKLITSDVKLDRVRLMYDNNTMIVENPVRVG